MANNFKLISKTDKTIKWRKLDNSITVYVVHDLNIPFGRNDGTFYFIAKDNKDILAKKMGITKEQAIIYAKEYMNGISINQCKVI